MNTYLNFYKKAMDTKTECSQKEFWLTMMINTMLVLFVLPLLNQLCHLPIMTLFQNEWMHIKINWLSIGFLFIFIIPRYSLFRRRMNKIVMHKSNALLYVLAPFIILICIMAIHHTVDEIAVTNYVNFISTVGIFIPVILYIAALMKLYKD